MDCLVLKKERRLATGPAESPPLAAGRRLGGTYTSAGFHGQCFRSAQRSLEKSGFVWCRTVVLLRLPPLLWVRYGEFASQACGGSATHIGRHVFTAGARHYGVPSWAEQAAFELDPCIETPTCCCWASLPGTCSHNRNSTDFRAIQ